MRTYRGKTILITGASSGIGAAMARQLADPSVTLLLTGRSAERLEEVAGDVRAYGTHVQTFPMDLGVPGAATALHRAVTEAGYHVDVLINNAGFGRLGAFVEGDVQNYEEMVDLNIRNLVSLTRLFLPDMIASGDGGILNVASTAAYQPMPYFAVYAASKAFVLSFSEGLHAELAPLGVTVTCLSPGFTATRFGQRSGANPLNVPALTSTAEDVARDGLRALLQGRRTIVSSLPHKLSAIGGHLAPRGVLTRAMAGLLRARLQPDR